MKISLIHPSRGRPYQSDMNSRYWFSKTKADVELICAIDSSDPKKVFYRKVYGDTCHVFPSESVVEATNFAAQKTTGDILVYLSDDFKCPDNWGELIIKEFENEKRPLVLKVDDCLQPFHTKILTIPIMNRALYEKLGYFFHPGYKSMFCDEHLFWVCHRIGGIKNCQHLKFPHEHYSNGKAVHDETYKKSEANWNQGKDLFTKHKSIGFPI